MAADSLALIALYNSTDGANWTTNTGWVDPTNNNVSTWHGVTVSGSRVTSLDVSSNNLAGILPTEIGNLTSLTDLRLYSNQLSGSIPTEIGNLTSLTKLYLSNNQLSGNLPIEIGNLTSLTYLSLYTNQLSGSIPTEIGNLTSVTSMLLRDNQFSGSIPTEIGTMASLTNLDLQKNQLSGSVPSEIWNMTILRTLWLNSNQLSGNISITTGNLDSLTALYLNDNNFDTLPDLTNLIKLVYVRLYDNKFTFEDIIPNVGITDIFYTPQDSVGVQTTKYITEGESYSHPANVGGTGNVYQWYKDGVILTGQTTNILNITNYTNDQAGVYVCYVTNPSAPDLTIYTHLLTLVKPVELTTLTDITVNEGEKIDFNVQSNTYDSSNPVTYSMNAPTLPNGAGASFNSSTKRFLWNTNFKHAGVYTVTFSVTNGIVTDSKSMTIRVLDVDHTGGMTRENTKHITKSNGGTVQVDTTGLYKKHKVIIPPAALLVDANVVAGPPTTNNIPQSVIDAYPSAVDFTVEGHADYVFEDSVEITIEYKDFETETQSNTNNNADITDDAKKDRMRIHYWDNVKKHWKRVMSKHTHDKANNTVTAKVKHFTVFGAIALIESSETIQISEGWNMVSLPVDPQTTTTPQDMFSDNINPFRTEEGNSNIYEFGEATNKWKVPTAILNSKGYIIYGFGGGSIDALGIPVTGNIITTVTKNGDGWNLVGNPYNVNIDWSTDVTVSAGVSSTYYKWTGSQYEFYPGGGLTSTISPWEAIFVNTSTNNSTVSFSYPGVSKRNSSTPILPDMRIQIIAQSGDLVDEHNYFGISDNSSIDVDDFDVYELTSLNDKYISAFFGQDDIKLTQDIKPESGSAWVWNFSVNTNSDAPVTLSWDIAEIEYDVVMHVLATDEKIDMTKVKNYTFEDSDNVSKFELLLGKNLIDEPIVPQEYYLKQNYPNPFNPETVIEFGLPVSGNVTLKIYNTLGQEIKTLINTNLRSGTHKFKWNGRNSLGQRVASGIYIYKINSGSYVQTKKMILIR